MPTYEYECKKCGHTFEAFQSMSDEPLKSCPQCGKEVRRLIHGGTGVIFKGSGFYVTDKGKGAAKSAKPAGSAAAGASASGSEKSSVPAGAAAESAAKSATPAADVKPAASAKTA
jgi:putative FmdB family regulatory protein